MWPDQPYAPARGSFERPVPLPLGNADADPSHTVTIACEWLPYVRGALQQLLLQATWDTTSPDALLLVQQRAFSLIDLFVECSGVPAISCPYNFTVSGSTPDGFVVEDDDPGFTPDYLGVFASGEGWHDSLEYDGTTSRRGLAIKRTFSPAVSMNGLALNFALVKGVFSGYSVNNLLMAHLAGGGAYSNVVNPATLLDGPQEMVLGFAAADVDYVLIRLWCGAHSPGADPGGSTQLLSWGYSLTDGGCVPGE